MKKILLFIGMFLFIFNVKALTFDVNLTNIEDKGNNGTIGSITNIDLENKAIDAYFQDIGDEVNFALTITNSGDRAGTLRSIGITSSNDKIEYTHSLPEGGLAINGNDTNMVTIKAKVLPGATNGTSSTELKITYNYDEGSCPEGEILSDDESMCLCPAGMERNETGICVTPEKPVECKDDEIYNETKKICEKKVVPVNPSNPKTMDNIILITLLFVVSGLGIYAVMFKKLKTNKKKAVAGVITGVTTLALSFTVLASVFGLDNLLSAIVNPITKSKEITITVNEEIDLIETWDGECSLEVSQLTPENIFEGGTGTEQDPYQVKTAEQLSCFAKSITNGTTYEGQYIKQTKNIKLNDNLNAQVAANNLTNAHLWITAGVSTGWSTNEDTRYFAGTYDGDNHMISGLYITNDSLSSADSSYNYKGMFAESHNATFKNMILSDVYMNTKGKTGALIGYAHENLTLDNITTYGNGVFDDNGEYYSAYDGAGIISNYKVSDNKDLIIENTTNNINLSCGESCAGVVARINGDDGEYNIVLKNVVNNGNLTFIVGANGSGGIIGYYLDNSGNSNILIENCINTGNFTGTGYRIAGLFGTLSGKKIVINNSYNSGNILGLTPTNGPVAGIVSEIRYLKEFTMNGCWNSGKITSSLTIDEAREAGYGNSYASGLVGGASPTYGDSDTIITITNSYNTGDIYVPRQAYVAGLFGKYEDSYYNQNFIIKDCYNTGSMVGYHSVGGLVGLFNGKVENSYNSGDITAIGDGIMGGLVGYGYSKIYNSYNTGTINVKNGSVLAGGLCAQNCRNIENSYNTGDLIVESPTGNTGGNLGGILGQYGTVINCFNSGNILIKSQSGTNIGGISTNDTVTNSYNLGDITLGDGMLYGQVGGIGVGNVTNSVNKGNITIKGNSPQVQVGGILSYSGSAENCFNAGTITVAEAILNNASADDLLIGEISTNYSNSATLVGNKWNTNPNGKALGCTNATNWMACTLEQSESAGSYTTEEAPDILSIINGDDAFEILEGETLPTLKVFNQ